MVLFILTTSEAYASHAQGADLTYQCLGGNQYQFTLKFYRDCSGANAPNNVTIDCSSASCNQNFQLTLNPVPNTGIEVTPICPSQTTTCTNGNNPGVREYIYQGVTNIPACSDWIFSFTLCCRNAAISTINNPGAENIYVEARLDNLNFPCNSSPTFTNRPVPYICVGQSFCFNHGASDPDGDLLVYSLIPPATGPLTTVTFLPPYTAVQPLASTPPVSFNTQTGDICMTPTLLQVAVMAVRVEEWRNNQLVGSVIRDIQVQTQVCSNINPSINGINGTGVYVLNGCAGAPINFFTNSLDPDPGQNITMTWNNGITAATFTVSGGPLPTGTFSWTPTAANVGPAPHCFTVTVQDDNCPVYGSQTYSFCLYISGINVSIVGSNANCGASNGSATASASGGTGPYSYQWLPNLGNNATQNGLGAGTYTVVVTDVNGCQGSATVTILNNGMPGNIQMLSTMVSCAGGNNGTATANVNGQPPFTYLWSNGGTTATISNLTAGTYSVVVTNGPGCTATASVTITAPALLSLTSVQGPVTCAGGSNGSATVIPAGGTGPYSYQWSNGATTATVNNLSALNYFVTVTDANACTATINILITEPPQLQTALSAFNNVTCFGDTNGSASVLVTGGTPPYAYLWNTNPPQIYQTANNLGAGTYQVIVTDANGCTSTMNAVINQPLPVTATFSSTPVSCYGGNNGSASVSPSGGTAPYTFSWNTVPIQNSQNASNLSSGNYNVIITDIYGCSGTVIVTVNQPTPLVATVSNVSPATCNGGTNGTATGNATGGTFPYSYQWNTTPPQNNAAATGLSAGTYTLTITDDNGCAAVTTVVITQPAPLFTQTSGNDTICPGQNTLISANSYGGSGPYTYLWNQGLGFGPAHIVGPNNTTIYTVITTDANGCTAGPDTVILSVFQLSSANISTSGTPAVCAGSQAQISASVSGFTGPVTYSWSHNLGSGPGPINVYPTATTTYTVTVTNICGISATSAVTIVVNPIPQIILSPVTSTGCDAATVSFTDTASANFGCTYNWNFGDGHYSTAQHPVHQYTQTGAYTITVTITSPWGCTGTATTWAAVTVNLSAQAQFTANPVYTTNLSPTITFTDQSTNASSWYWDFGDGNTSTVQHPVHTYTSENTFRVMLVTNNAAGCPDTAWLDVKVDPEFTFYIPNAFTPNGDHMNDEFRGEGDEITSYKMEIFDRWGMLIFQTENLYRGWDGRANGGNEIAQEDVYVYRVVLRDFAQKEHTFTGHVSLIR
ncbi:MAG: gliding motility-associated C-terminal domain-containing protein [Bacteroidia bacterium]|nr:gliding motility-associated C-terminal domain-containing protein [Bacteroidia bacterium]